MDTLCLKAGIQGISTPVSGVSAGLDFRTTLPPHVGPSAVGRPSASMSVDEPSSSSSSHWGFSFRHSLTSLWPRTRYHAVSVDGSISVDEEAVARDDRPSGNWAARFLRLGSLRTVKEEAKPDGEFGKPDAEFRCRSGRTDVADDNSVVCPVDDEEDAGVEFNRDSFSKLLRRVSLRDARLYAQLANLGNLAYSVAQIKPENLLRCYGLRFITSSSKKKQQAKEAENGRELVEEDKLKKENDVALVNEAKGENGMNLKENGGNGIRASAVYRTASYLYSQTSSFLLSKSSRPDRDELKSKTIGRYGNTNVVNVEEVVSFMATTESVTSVVAAKEEVKQAVADDLNSTHSSPCEWFACDDDQSGTRFFVIQGSETLESWQANLLFEPAQFEGLDVPVHRGIYEAAKGMYEQILPEVRAHIKSRGKCAKFRFTGHSLGGSLSLLLNLMLLIRGEVPVYSLLPVITFGSPSVMCGGDCFLRKLGLPQNHVQSITLHRDIVPRAFSCKYPNHVAEFLKAVNSNFRKHPCLNNQKLLYAPMGELLILQPDEEFSPGHHLLPAGSGLYLLSCGAGREAEKQIRMAQAVFLNSPHPLEILSERAAYGHGGTVQRDHDMISYMKSIRGVIHKELNRIREYRKEHMRAWGPFVGADGFNFVRAPSPSGKIIERRVKFSGMLRTGKESVKRFSTLVASQHMHLLVVLLLPARLLVFAEAYNRGM